MDSHTPRTSHTGRLHGMPLAWLLGQDDDRSTACPPAWSSREHVALVGVRSFEPEEKERLDRLGVRVFHIEEVATRGLDAVFDEALAIARPAPRASASASTSTRSHRGSPGVGTPVPGGVVAAELARAWSASAVAGRISRPSSSSNTSRAWIPRAAAPESRSTCCSPRYAGRARSRRSSPSRSSRTSFSLSRCLERRRRRKVEHPLRRVAEEARVEVDQELVDAALAHQRAVQPEARLDMQLVDAAPAPAPRASRGSSTLPCAFGSTTTSRVPRSARLPRAPRKPAPARPGECARAAASPGGCRRSRAAAGAACRPPAP